MPSTNVPTNVAELLDAAKKATGNIAKHREAMAEVAAIAHAAQPQPAPVEMPK